MEELGDAFVFGQVGHRASQEAAVGPGDGVDFGGDGQDLLRGLLIGLPVVLAAQKA
jgi:hypothetical protein